MTDILLFLLALVLGSLVTRWYSQRTEISVDYDKLITFAPKLIESQQNTEKLKVVYGSEEIEEKLSTYQLRIWKSGNTIIEKEKVRQPINIIFKDENGDLRQIYMSNVVYSHENSVKSIIEENSGQSSYIEFERLDPGEGIAISYLVQEPSSHPEMRMQYPNLKRKFHDDRNTINILTVGMFLSVTSIIIVFDFAPDIIEGKSYLLAVENIEDPIARYGIIFILVFCVIVTFFRLPGFIQNKLSKRPKFPGS